MERQLSFPALSVPWKILTITVSSEKKLMAGHTATGWGVLMCTLRMVNVSFYCTAKIRQSYSAYSFPLVLWGFWNISLFPGGYMEQNKTSASSLHFCCLLYLAPSLKWLWAFINRELSQHWAHVKDGVGFPLWRLKTEDFLCQAQLHG